jgi:hypothetical protein
MLFLGILVWINLVYNLRVASAGLFSYGFLRLADDELLTRASELFSGAEPRLRDNELLFVRRLAISSLFEMSCLLAEMALMAYLIWRGGQRPLALAVLLKDLAYIGVTLQIAWRQSAAGVLDLHEVKTVSQRYLLPERAAYLFSALAMGWLLYSMMTQTPGLVS